MDIDRIRADNDLLVEAERKNGLVINSGREWRGWRSAGRQPRWLVGCCSGSGDCLPPDPAPASVPQST